MDIKIGQEARGYFQKPPNGLGRKETYIMKGTVTEVGEDMFRVRYGEFEYVYTEKNIGKIVFLTNRQQEEAEQEERERRW